VDVGVSVGVRVWVRYASRLVELTILLENLQIGARARVDAVGRAHVDGLLDDVLLVAALVNNHRSLSRAGLARVSGRSIFSLLGWGSSPVRRKPYSSVTLKVLRATHAHQRQPTQLYSSTHIIAGASRSVESSGGQKPAFSSISSSAAEPISPISVGRSSR